MSTGAPGRKRERLDRLLVERELVESRARGQAVIMAGDVLVDGVPVSKPGTLVKLEAEIRVRGDFNPYVSRGGLKLHGALEHFAAGGLSVRGRVALDVGASTGGFTDCLLQAGVVRVHSVDVGYGQLAWKLASDPRVVPHDRTNIRNLDPDVLGERMDVVVVDCSFIAFAKVVVCLPPFLAPAADVVALVKPQFELEPPRVGRGGIVRADADRSEAVQRARAAAADAGFVFAGQVDSQLAGREGNREVFLWLRALAGRVGEVDRDT